MRSVGRLACPVLLRSGTYSSAYSECQPGVFERWRRATIDHVAPWSKLVARES
jgi:hypothetical protein